MPNYINVRNSGNMTEKKKQINISTLNIEGTVHVCVRECMRVCVCVCMCVKEREREREREREGREGREKFL